MIVNHGDTALHNLLIPLVDAFLRLDGTKAGAKLAHATTGDGWGHHGQRDGARQDRRIVGDVLEEVRVVGGDEGDVTTQGEIRPHKANL